MSRSCSLGKRVEENARRISDGATIRNAVGVRLVNWISKPVLAIIIKSQWPVVSRGPHSTEIGQEQHLPQHVVRPATIYTGHGRMAIADAALQCSLVPIVLLLSGYERSTGLGLKVIGGRC